MYNGNQEILEIFTNAYSDKRNENDCWIWKGSIDKTTGYGKTSYLGETMFAHKAVYILAYGDYQKVINGRKICLRHLCNNRLCINPKHITIGTYTDNGRDAALIGKGTKLDKEKLKIAIELRENSKLTYNKIGKILNISANAVSNALNGRNFYSRELLRAINNNH